ncbi:MAG: peroxiredoxin [Nitrospira sp.]|nr:peroxiredoxin [Nitrospira sp.]
MSKDIAVGQAAPELSIPDQHGKTVTLKSFKGKQIVLYFYPKDDTPGCTKESCDFRDVESQILRAGGMIVGVSLDGKEKSMYGRKYWGIERSTFVIDADGKVKAIFRKVKVDGHADEVLTALKA